MIHYLPPVFFINVISKYCADKTTDDVGGVGDVVVDGDAAVDLLADEDDNHQYEGERYLALPEARKGCQYDQCEDNSAGAAKGNMYEEYVVDHPCHNCGDADNFQHRTVAVFFFKHRTEQQ